MHAMLETDVAVDAEFMSSLAKIVQDGGPVHDRPRAFPRAERVAEREHVGIGADAGKAKKVPGAAHVRASFKDYIALARTAGLQTVAGSDAGEAGTDDHDIEMLHGHGSDASPLPVDCATKSAEARVYFSAKLRECAAECIGPSARKKSAPQDDKTGWI